jgi:predicted alpha-1,6-mannanase (GH76 family)
MAEWGALLIVLAGLFILGHLLNYFSQSAYWWWADWRAIKEDEKMLRDQEKQEENVPDNVVKLDDVRKTTFIMSNYDDDTIH